MRNGLAKNLVCAIKVPGLFGTRSEPPIGLVIASGLAIGTLFTLFVVPGVYMLIGANHSSDVSDQRSEA